MTVKLFNKGQRSITFAGKDNEDTTINPQESVSVNKETAAYLQKLYGDELLDIDSVKEKDSDSALVAEKTLKDAKAEAQKIIDAANEEAAKIKLNALQSGDGNAAPGSDEQADAAGSTPAADAANNAGNANRGGFFNKK